MKCAQCDAVLPESARFRPGCGAPWRRSRRTPRTGQCIGTVAAYWRLAAIATAAAVAGITVLPTS